MSDDDHDTPYTAGEIDSAIRETYSELLDVNQTLIKKARRQAERLEEIRDLYVEQIGRLNDLMEMHVQAAMVVSTTIGDILATEWDIQDNDDTTDTDTDTDDDNNDQGDNDE